MNPQKEWNPLCLAPWVHSFVHTSGHRALCCISEPEDTDSLISQKEHWNSPSIKLKRLQLLSGKLPKACSSCASSTNPKYNYFNETFQHLKKTLEKNTASDGTLALAPASFDHRISNLCNFKCRMCNSEYSSQREKEVIELKGAQSLPLWQQEPRYTDIKKFHKENSEQELLNSIENRTIEEIYWAGGEPLLLPFHWQAMGRICELGLVNQVFVRYNTNLSTLQYKGSHLFKDLLVKFPRYLIMASLDGTGKIGEYIRTGIKWDMWLANFNESLSFIDHKNQRLGISLCLTTPGILDLKNLLLLSNNSKIPIAAQRVDFGAEGNLSNPLSPLSLPQELLEKLVAEVVQELTPLRSIYNQEVFNELAALIPAGATRPANNDSILLRQSLKRIQKIESHRNANSKGTTILEIFEKKPYLQKWLTAQL